MTSCQKNWVPKCGSVEGKCKRFQVPGCWQGYDTWQKGQGKGGCVKPRKWYVRRTGTSYNSILDTGPLGHPKANGFSNVLFEKNVPVWLWLDSATRRGKGPTACRYRCKGHGRLKGPAPAQTSTPSHSSSSRSVAPPFQSYETVLAVRKAMAYYDPKNYKTSKKWRRANCRY